MCECCKNLYVYWWRTDVLVVENLWCEICQGTFSQNTCKIMKLKHEFFIKTSIECLITLISGNSRTAQTCTAYICPLKGGCWIWKESQPGKGKRTLNRFRVNIVEYCCSETRKFDWMICLLYTCLVMEIICLLAYWFYFIFLGNGNYWAWQNCVWNSFTGLQKWHRPSGQHASGKWFWRGTCRPYVKYLKITILQSVEIKSYDYVQYMY